MIKFDPKCILSAMLLNALLLTSLASCSGTSNDGEADTTAADNAETTAEVTEPVRQSGLPEKDWEGRTVNFITRSEDYGNWQTKDIYTESEDGETINDAVYLRNSICEDKYGFVVAENRQGDLATVILKLVQSGDSTYDAAVVSGSNGSSLATGQALVDFKTIPNINLENEWWDQNAVKDFTVNNMVFMGVSDMLISDKDGGWIYTFNKTMADDYNIEYPYEMAKNGTWTYDKFYDMAKQVPDDLNGDGEMKFEDDQFGIGTEPYDTYAGFFYSGARIYAPNEDGYPDYVLYNEHNINAFNNYLTILKDSNTYTNGSDHAIFLDGRALFRGTTLLTIRQKYRDMEDDFGLVVAPKYTEEQESYAHVVSIGTSASVTVVPRTASDLDFTGFVLEAMSFESTETLRDSYLKVAFNGKYLRDEDSIEMLDLGIDTRVFDLSIIYTNWGTNWLITLYNVKPGQDFDITSVYASTEEATKTAIENTLELYNALK